MHEGQIIKFYREKANLTQEQLGRGICSVTHISKIERGLTEYSPEITSLLASRLGIDVEKEIESLSKGNKLLYCWNDAMAMEKLDEIESIRDELKKIPLINISDSKILYDLLTAKYYLFHKSTKKAYLIIKELEKKEAKLPQFEQCLLKHVLGIFYLLTNEYIKAIDTLKHINPNHYSNHEYYHHLAIAYHHLNHKVMAYHYAEKALQYYKQYNNFKKIIDLEMLMLIQISDESEDYHFKQILDHYESLIQCCDVCSAMDKKSALYHNLAYEYFKRSEFHQSIKFYKESMLLKDNKSSYYLLSLHGYLSCCIESNSLERDEILSLIQEGLSTSREINDKLYIMLFNILKYQILEDYDEYYHFIASKALKYFKTHNHNWLFQYYGKKLFEHYLKTDEENKALEIACSLI